jgi:hypothetical protein
VTAEALIERVREAAGLPRDLADAVVEALWSTAPLAQRRAARDRMLRAAAARWRDVPLWTRARWLADLVRAARQGRRAAAPEDSPEALVHRAIAAYGRGLSVPQAYRVITTCTEGVEMKEAPVACSTNKENTIMTTRAFIEAGEDQRDKFIRAGVSSIVERAGHQQLIEAASKVPRFAPRFEGFTGDGGEWRGATLTELARGALELHGISTKGVNGEALVRHALSFRSGMNTTSDFATLLENALSKVFLGAYAVTPVTFRRWCALKSVKDFRTASFFRPGSFGVLDTITEGGEIKQRTVPDGEKSQITPASKGNIIGLSRRAIVNDDLEAFRDLASALGEAAAYTIEGDVFALLTANNGLGPAQSDGQPLFHSTRANIGGTGAMSVDTWGSAAAVMAAQQDPSKNVILELEPAVWLGPSTLKMKAKTLNTSAADPSAPNSGVGNPVQGMVRDVVGSSRLSGTRHYFLADPSLYPAFAVGFIDGVEEPRIDQQKSFRFDGVEWRIVIDYGVAVLDHRAGVTCAGA